MMAIKKGHLALGSAWSILFIAGLIQYPGSVSLYVLLSFVSLTMLLSGMAKGHGYGYLFVVIFLWLGFWFKLSASYLLLGYFPVEEAIGGFDYTADSWDLVLWLAIAGHVGVLLARALYECLGSKVKDLSPSSWAPSWYPAYRRWLWTVLLLAVIGIPVLNVFLGIQLIGLTPRTILPWPLNALIAWLLNIGLALSVAVLLEWELAQRKDVSFSMYAVLLEGVLSMVSIISRATFLFHVLPQLYALSKIKQARPAFTKGKVLILAVMFVVFFVGSLFLVSKLRDYHYHAAGRDEALEDTRLPPSFRFHLIQQLVINRWVGVEGVMAVSSYKEKSLPLLWTMLQEKRELDKVSAYQKISNSGYQSTKSKYQFASLPGATAFFFYSGSFVAVILGLAALTFIVLLAERLIPLITRNSLICSLFGATAANTLAQFGLTPRQDLPYFAMIFLFALFIYAIQAEKWYLPGGKPVNA